jgi:hypothetical protein
MKEYYKNSLKQLSCNKLRKYDFIGFDVETYGKDNLFYLGGLFYFTEGKKEVYKVFYSRDEMIEFILTFKFQGKYIVATNLGFDLTTLFYNTKYWNDLKILERGSAIIYAEYVFKNSDKKGKIKFIDTLNYAPFSVEKLGKIINIPKQTKPKFLGEIPTNEQDKKYLEYYNMYDCLISCKFMYFLQEGIITDGGGNLKITIASTSFDIWRRNFQPSILIKESWVLDDKEIKNFIFGGYYGGRTEVFKRGLFKNVSYYDINSLYPSVMRLAFPLPQSVKKVSSPSIDYVLKYMGVTECEVFCPYMNKPLLPYKEKKTGKLIFPTGKFKGTWNNCELQLALKLGYKILKIYKQIIYTENFYPFKNFVEHFYKKRQDYKDKGSNMEHIVKLILNSLYGKFGQKRIKKSRVIDLNNYEGDYEKLKLELTDDFIIKGNKLLINVEEEYDGKNVYPILASYVTSYSRVLMYHYIDNENVIYTDTDSLVCEKPIYSHSKKLGELKLEGTFKEAFFVKPKFYYCLDDDGYHVKVKGLCNATIEDFLKMLKKEVVYKTKFAKLKESIRQELNVNEIINIPKLMNLEDNKRLWFENESKPLELSE